MFRLAERFWRRSEELRERGLRTLLALRVRDDGLLAALTFIRASSSGDIGTGDEGERLAGGMYLFSFRPRVSCEAFLERYLRAEV